MAKSTRTVTVNVNRWGMIHEVSCKWLNSDLRAGLNAASYKTMPANAPAAAGKLHCSRC